jgi:hypothetical protein
VFRKKLVTLETEVLFLITPLIYIITSTVVAEPGGSVPLIPKPTTGRDPESVLSNIPLQDPP